MKKIGLLNDRFQKTALDISTPQGRNYASLIIYETTGIVVNSILPLDRVITSQIDSSKSSQFDNYFIVNERYIINIEIQNKALSAKSISDKSQYYLSMMMTSFTKKGSKFGTLNDFILIILYNGSISDRKEFIVLEEFTSKTESQYVGKLYCYILQLNKLISIYNEKGIDNMTRLEGVCFYMKNSDNENYKKEIKELLVKEETVQYLDDLANSFNADAIRMLAIRSAEIHDQEMMDIGEERGQRIGKERIVTKLLLQGILTYEEISECSGLTAEEIKEIESQLFIKD